MHEVEHAQDAGPMIDTESAAPSAFNTAGGLQSWLRTLSPNELNVYGETMNETRHGYDAMWGSMRAFYAVNGLVVTVMGVLGRQAEYVQDGLAVGSMAIIGLAITGAALRILFLQWREYTDALHRKAVLERELGFHHARSSGPEPSSIWHGQAEGSRGQLFLLALPYLAVIVVYLAALVLVAAGFISGYFFEKAS
jgi:hypothetical protein